MPDGSPRAATARWPTWRADPSAASTRAGSIRGCARLSAWRFPYQAPAPARIDWRREMRGRIASYAMGGDYHDRVMKSAKAVAADLMRLRPSALARLYVDTGPVFEREWAREAGLGWFGKNTNLLNREHGSYFFLAEIFTDLELGAVQQRSYRRFLRDVPAMPRSVPDAGAGKRVRDGAAAMHLLSDDRAARTASIGAAFAPGQLDFRLRHLPGSLPLERSRADPVSELEP